MSEKKRQQIIRSASRPCGMSYRSAYNRGLVELANNMVREGVLFLQDTGRTKGRFKFRVKETK